LYIWPMHRCGAPADHEKISDIVYFPATSRYSIRATTRSSGWIGKIGKHY
jgi:hypothetical protein